MQQGRGNDFDGRRPSTLSRGSASASFHDRVAARRYELPAAMQRVVRLIEDDPQALVEGTITSLAETAGVAPSTVTRLSKELGYASVARMRMAFAREQSLADTEDPWVNDLGPELSPDDDPQALLEKLTFTHLRMIRATATRLDVGLLQHVAERIAVADRVDLYAIGGSANAAQMFADRTFRIGVQSRVWSEAHAGLVSASFLGPSSVAIAVSRSGRTPEVARLIGEARGAGALTVAMVGTAGSRVASAADVTIVTSPAEDPGGGDLMPRYGQGFALDLLFLLVARLDVEATTRRLARTSRSVERHRRDLEEGSR